MNTPRTPTPQHPRGLYAVALSMIGLTCVMLGMLTRRWADGAFDGSDLAIYCGWVLMGMTFVALWLCWWRQAVLRERAGRYEEEQMRKRGELPARDLDFDCKVCNGRGGSQ